MNNKMKLAGLILGAALTTSAAYAANGSCGAGKCGGDMKKEATSEVKDMKEKATTEVKDMKEKASGSCGAGKCGSK